VKKKNEIQKTRNPPRQKASGVISSRKKYRSCNRMPQVKQRAAFLPTQLLRGKILLSGGFNLFSSALLGW
jgi:hypothetical protein